ISSLNSRSSSSSLAAARISSFRASARGRQLTPFSLGWYVFFSRVSTTFRKIKSSWSLVSEFIDRPNTSIGLEAPPALTNHDEARPKTRRRSILSIFSNHLQLCLLQRASLVHTCCQSGIEFAHQPAAEIVVGLP